MPGTIQVSVLELLDLPSSLISVKVSMGMKEHQVWDKGGEFSFPLTTLRDNLVVALYDVEGNELSRTGMSTKVVVEKGIWEDLFPLEGGGQLHMKLQFILSEKERKRIRDMRETALKKKQEELLINGAKFREMASVTKVALNIVPAFNNEVTVTAFSEDLRESDAQMDTRNIGGRYLQDRATLSTMSPVTYPNFGSVKTEEVRLRYASPTNTDERKRTTAEAETSQDYKGVRLVEASQQIVKTSDSQSLPDGVPSELISSARAFEYLKTPTKNDTDGAKGTSSVPMSSQDHRSFPLTEAARPTPVKTNTQSPPNAITMSPSSSPNVTVKQVSWEKSPTNETDRDQSSSEATRQISVKIATQSPPNSITTMSNSLQNQSNSTIRQTASVRTPRDNEIDKKTSSEETQQIPMMVDPQSLPNDITTGINTMHNQDHRITKQILLEKTPGNNGADEEETSSESTQRVPMEIGTREPGYYSTPSNSLQNRAQSTVKQTALNGTEREDASSVAQMSEEQKISDHTETTFPLTEKTDIQPSPNVFTTKFISSKKDLEKSKFVFGEKVFSASRPLVENQTHGSENQSALAKSPMNVRKLISALESSQSQGLGPRANAPKLKFHLSRVRSEGSLKGVGANEVNMENSEANKQDLDTESIPFFEKAPLEARVQDESHLNKVNTEVPLEGPSINEVKNESTQLKKQILEGALNPFSLGNPLEPSIHQNVKNVRSQKEVNLDVHIAEASDSLSISQNINPFEVLNEKPLATAGTNSIKQVDRSIQQNSEKNNRHEELLEDSSVTCQAETATISGRILDDPMFSERIHTVPQSSRMLDAVPAAVAGISTSEQVDCNIHHKDENRNRQEAFLDKLVVPSEAETATTSGRLLEDPLRKVYIHGVHHEQQYSLLSVLDESRQRTKYDMSDEIKTSLEKQKPVEYLGVEQSYSEAMGNWILPDESSLCITSGSKQMMDFMECFETSGHRIQRETSLCSGLEKVDSATCVQEKEPEMSSDNLRNSKLDRSEDDRVPGVLIGQAAKIVIAMAVGTIVVVLRSK